MLIVRDLISWVDFFIAMEKNLGSEYALFLGLIWIVLICCGTRTILCPNGDGEIKKLTVKSFYFITERAWSQDEKIKAWAQPNYGHV